MDELQQLLAERDAYLAASHVLQDAAIKVREAGGYCAELQGGADLNRRLAEHKIEQVQAQRRPRMGF